MMEEHINAVLQNQNQQTIINKNLEDSTNILTEKYNQWTKSGANSIEQTFKKVVATKNFQDWKFKKISYGKYHLQYLYIIHFIKNMFSRHRPVFVLP
jgi:glutathionyl-hydroquinone reductase